MTLDLEEVLVMSLVGRLDSSLAEVVADHEHVSGVVGLALMEDSDFGMDLERG